jgi:hypothetical protein
MYARVVREGPPLKKYSMLPSDRSGGRLFDISLEERQRRDATDVAFIADMEADAIVLEAVHRPRRQQEAQETPFPLKWENSKSQILQNGSNRCIISCHLARIELNLVECILNLG